MDNPTSPAPAARPRRAALWVSVFVLGAVAVAGAAYIAGQMLGGRDQPGEGPGLFRPIGPGGEAGLVGAVQQTQLNVTPAPELPVTPPEAQGLFVRREDNSVFIGAGNQSLTVIGGGDSGGDPQIKTNFDGPVLEVVTTQKSRIYRETTQLALPDAGAQAPEAIHQTVAVGTLDEIGENSNLIVWGRRNGDRIIAEVILFSTPTMGVRVPAP